MLEWKKLWIVVNYLEGKERIFFLKKAESEIRENEQIFQFLSTSTAPLKILFATHRQITELSNIEYLNLL